jgi:glycosyltransferase involved in cell wall biosynthesis
MSWSTQRPLFRSESSRALVVTLAQESRSDLSAGAGARGVEVIVCTFNGDRFVSPQLRTILDQTIGVDRLSIYDDCSTDATVQAIETVRHDARGNSAIALTVNSRNLGYAGNFASAIAHATGKVVFLSDQDDLWEPHKVQTLIELMNRTGADMVFSDGTPIDTDGRVIQGPTVLQALGLSASAIEEFWALAWEELLRRNVVNGAACAVRRRVAQAALPLPTDMPHDQWLALWCAAHNGVAATPRSLYRYRQHDRNAIGMGSQRTFYQWLGVWRQPRKPRLRELQIWRAVHARLAPVVPHRRRAQLEEKLRFLEEVVARERRAGRAIAIVRHLLRGNYRRYAPPTALWRDLLGLWREDRVPPRASPR